MMVFSKITKLTSIQLVMALRSVAILIQTILILAVVLVLNYELPLLSLMTVVITELAFNVFWYAFYRNGKPEQKIHLVIQLLADVIFLGCLLYLSGGATNAFVSLLLIPIAIAAVSLSLKGLAFITLAAIAIYTFLLWLVPIHAMHGNMEAHFIGMWINFLFSAVVVSVVVNRMAYTIHQRELTIAKFREEQLKQERIIALGVASAQVTHDLATPIASMRLLMDELKEEAEYDQEIIADIDTQLARCSDNLHAFRQTTDDIKQNKRVSYSVCSIFSQVKQHCQLNYPQIDFRFQALQNTATIRADSALVPAIVNVINNAVIASTQMQSQQVDITSKIVEQQWQLVIRDFGKGFKTEHFSQLGSVPLQSEQGFGMAIMLSNASIERLKGHLSLENHQQGGAQVVISLPLEN